MQPLAMPYVQIICLHESFRRGAVLATVSSKNPDCYVFPLVSRIPEETRGEAFGKA